MAHKKGGGSSSNGRDSNPKYLGVKKFGNQFVNSGSILVRQNGTKFFAGYGVRSGRDNTLYASKSGFLKFSTKNNRKYLNIFSKQNVEL